MGYTVVKIPKATWEEKYAENAHISVFDDFAPKGQKIDFACLVENEKEELVSYCTFKELNAEQVVLEYGGTFPDKRGSVHAFPSFMAILESLKKDYKKALFVTNNDNWAMLKFGMKARFKITGVTLHTKL